MDSATFSQVCEAAGGDSGQGQSGSNYKAPLLSSEQQGLKYMACTKEKDSEGDISIDCGFDKGEGISLECSPDGGI